MNGFILLARSILDNELWIKKPAWWLKAWIYILFKVNYTDTHSLKRGQGLFNRNQIYSNCGLSAVKSYSGKSLKVSAVYKFIQWARSNNLIRTEKKQFKTIITVINYDHYQDIAAYKKSGIHPNEAIKIKAQQILDSLPAVTPQQHRKSIPTKDTTPHQPKTYKSKPTQVDTDRVSIKSQQKATVDLPIKKKELKKLYKEYVFLQNDEYDRLLSKFGKPATDQLIHDLNNYIGSKGVSYKSHYYTLLNWAKRNKINKISLDKKQSDHDQLSAQIAKISDADQLTSLLENTHPYNYSTVKKQITSLHGTKIWDDAQTNLKQISREFSSQINEFLKKI